MSSMHCRPISICFAERLRQLAEEPQRGGGGGEAHETPSAPHKMGCQCGW